MTARVLVVDGEPDAEPLFRQQFRREVREGLYQLDFARSGGTALDMLDGHVGEEIILLINMPGMSGLDLLPIVKKRRPDMPVFMISAYGDEDTLNAAQKRGADKFPTKPVDFAKLRRDIMAVQADAMRRNTRRAVRTHPGRSVGGRHSTSRRSQLHGGSYSRESHSHVTERHRTFRWWRLAKACDRTEARALRMRCCSCCAPISGRAGGSCGSMPIN